MNIYVFLAALFGGLCVPALVLGLNLAVIMDNMVFMPIPTLVTFILACVFMHKAEVKAGFPSDRS